jgi:hypothetical protein
MHIRPQRWMFKVWVHEGTFLNPGVDESANWSSRGALLQSYRELIAYLKENELIEADC